MPERPVLAEMETICFRFSFRITRGPAWNSGWATVDRVTSSPDGAATFRFRIWSMLFRSASRKRTITSTSPISVL